MTFPPDLRPNTAPSIHIYKSVFVPNLYLFNLRIQVASIVQKFGAWILSFPGS